VLLNNKLYFIIGICNGHNSPPFNTSRHDLHQTVAITPTKQHREPLKNSAKSTPNYIDTLTAQGLAISADRFREFIALI